MKESKFSMLKSTKNKNKHFENIDTKWTKVKNT